MIDQYPSANGVLTSLIWRKTAVGGETSLSGYDNSNQALSYTPGQEQVYLNGILLVRGDDYTATNGTSITGLTALAANDFVQINCYNNFSVASVPSTSITGTITNSQLAGSISNDKLSNSSITINGSSVSLGGSVSLTGDIEGITASSPLTGGGTSGTVTIGIQSASTTQLGAVQLTDSISSTSTTTAATANSVKSAADASISKSLVTAKGDIVVATGNATVTNLAAGANGKSLVVDSTQASGLRWGDPGNSYTSTITAPPAYVITGFTYSNPNLTFTTSTAHGYAVGQTVWVWNVGFSGAASPNSNGLVITGVTSNTFTINFGAATPGTYTSGGFTSLDVGSVNNQSGIMTGYYLNGNYIFAVGNTGSYIYSSDGVTWTWNQIPIGSTGTTGNMNSIAFGNSTYVFTNSANTTQVYSTSSLATVATARTHNMTEVASQVIYCGGTINRFVVVGGNAGGTIQGRIATSTDGITWTNQTIGGTNNRSLTGVAFDGSNTIVATGFSGATIIISTNGTSWTGYTSTATVSQIDGYGRSGGSVKWNSVASRFEIINVSNDRVQWGSSGTTAEVTTYWGRASVQNIPFTTVPNSQSNTDYLTIGSRYAWYDSAGSSIYALSFSGFDTQVSIYKYAMAQTLVSSNSNRYYHALTSIININAGIASSIWVGTPTAVQNNNGSIGHVYGNGKHGVLFSTQIGNTPLTPFQILLITE